MLRLSQQLQFLKNYKRIIAMKKSIIFLVFVISSLFALSQTQFNRILYDSTDNRIITQIITSDSTPYVALLVHGNQYGRQNFSIVGINESGDIVWDKEKFADDSVNNISVAYNALKKGQRGYYCCVKTSEGQTGQESLIIMDTCFNTKYINIIGCYNYIGEIQEYPNRDFYFSGQLYDSINQKLVANVVKTDSMGNVIWNKVVNQASYSAMTKLIISSDGNIVAGGKHGSDYSQWQLVKMDTSGNVIWQRYYGRNGIYPDGAITGLIETSDSCFLVSGKYPAVSIQGGYEFYYDGCLRKISKDGELLWEKRLRTYSIDMDGGSTYLKNEIVSIIISDGYVYVLGSDDYEHLLWYNSYLIKMDFNGNVLWKRIYYGENAYNCEQHLESFDRTPDGGFIMGGYGFYANIGYYPSQQPWIVKTDSLGVDGLTTASLPELNMDIDFPDTLYCGDTISCMLRLSGKSAPYQVSFSTGQTIDSIYYPEAWMPLEMDTGYVSIINPQYTYATFHETEATIVGLNLEQCIHKPIQFVVPNRIGVQQIAIEVRDFYGESKTITKEINVVGDCDSGIENIAEQSVSVYPNPARGSITIAGENIAGIEICNLLGEVVYYNSSVVPRRDATIVISTENMPAGSYFVRVRMADGKVVTKKIVVV